ncbi:MAG: PSD1 and planctomycete cytochrome C domain-containing protein [Haloferula sp.]
MNSACIIVGLGLLPVALAESVSYNRDIRPILSENCFLCHGFDKDKREADLRLDTFEGAISKHNGKPAILPGKPEESELIQRIFSADPDDLMPPPDTAYALDEKEKELLRRWIEEGAEYEEHWAYKKLERPEVPSFSSNPIDAFLERRWNERKVTPVDDAGPRVLLRRLSYDLRGLPPGDDELASFLKDPSRERFEQFAEKWLGSLEHAEHQALLWLDLVRFADSNGMVSDEPIASGPYRRYVIEAFRQNMPFDQFTREQLAGDLLPEVNDRTLTASAYNRLVKTNCEAGVIEKEALYALKGEHVRALGTVWLGTTTGCAECHDHKYDPISAKDYYSMAAFFDDLIEAGVYEPGDRRVPIHYLHEDAESTERDRILSQRIDEVRAGLYGSAMDSGDLEGWSKEVLKKSAEAKKLKGQVDWVWMPSELPAARVEGGDYEFTGDGRIASVPDGELSRHFCGETLNAGLIKEHSALFTHVTLDPDNPPQVIAIQTINGAYRRIGWHRHIHRTYYWGPKDHPSLKQTVPWVDPEKIVHMGPLPELGKRVRLEVPDKKFTKAIYAPQGMGWIQTGGTVIWGDSGLRVSPHRLLTNTLAESAYRYFWDLPFNRDDRDDFHSLLLTSLRLPVEKRRPIHTQLIEIGFRESAHPEQVEELTKLYREAARLRRDADYTLVSKVGTPKLTHLLERGSFMSEVGEPLEPAIPVAFGTLQEGRRLTRLDLANWLVAEDNPLTARVFVNRLWHQFYGRGISETLEDSGNQGAWPSHVDLLDWLAVEFRESGWDIRHMIRLLIRSDAYRLSSVPSPELAELDPTNRLHARQGRSRHSAEEIRDSALHAAGLLTLTTQIPTTSFYPYQPDPYWVKSNKIMYGSRYQIWDTNPGTDQYQRSLYTFWKRQNIHPSMLAFDAPTRQECTASRNITNTPAQALALLNDPQFVEAARVLAARVIEQAEEGERIDRLFEFTLQREPTEEERRIVTKLHQQMLERYRDKPDEAEALLRVGQASNPELAPDLHAAWTTTARVVLNLHEFITRS